MTARLLHVCPTCGVRHTRPYGYCLACHAANMREWRRSHPMTAEQRFKDRARSYANVYKKRGKLVPAPCALCSAKRAEMHHPDYGKPLQVVWLCRPCHLNVHRETSPTPSPQKVA